eukprot:3212113-Rhodomonas_salina.2
MVLPHDRYRPVAYDATRRPVLISHMVLLIPDVVYHIWSALKVSPYKGTPIHSILVDETQVDSAVCYARAMRCPVCTHRTRSTKS